MKGVYYNSSEQRLMAQLETDSPANDDEDVFERTMADLESFDDPERATSLRNVRANLYRHAGDLFARWP